MDVSSEPVALKAILDEEIERRPWRRAKWAYLLQPRWSLIVGEYLAKHTLLVSADQQAVVIAVPSSTWTQELTYWKPEIHRRLDELTQGETRRAEIRIRVWPKVFASRVPAQVRRSERGTRYHKASPPKDADLTQLLARVKDNYASAVEHWIRSGYVLCTQCQSPTLEGYQLCVRCERQVRRK